MLTKNIRSHRYPRLLPLTAVMLIILSLYSVTLVLMIYWAIRTALMDPNLGYYDFSGFSPVGATHFENLLYVFQNSEIENINGTVSNFPQMLGNTLLYSIGCALANTCVLCVTAYCCARYACRFSKFIYALVIVVMVIPVVGNQTSELDLAMKLGIYDSLWGLIIMKANFLGLYFLVFYETFKSLPSTYCEAAMLDGAGDAGIMLRICLPLARNTFFTIFIINFITYWNDFQIPVLYAPNSPTISVFLFKVRQYSKDLFSTKPIQLSAAIIILVPTLVLFLIFNKRLLGNLTVGGIKG